MNNRMQSAQVKRVAERATVEKISNDIAERLHFFAEFEQISILVEEFIDIFSTKNITSLITHTVLRAHMLEIVQSLSISLSKEISMDTFKPVHLQQLKEDITAVTSYWSDFIQLEKPITNSWDPQASGIISTFNVNLNKLIPDSFKK